MKNYLFRLYTYGYDISIQKLYPMIEFPVSLGTPMISPWISKGWNHNDDWSVVNFDENNLQTNGGQIFHVYLTSEEFKCVSGHKIGGKKILFCF